MDRASGSGIRSDPDALIDLVELEVSEELLLTQRLNQAACEVYKQELARAKQCLLPAKCRLLR